MATLKMVAKPMEIWFIFIHKVWKYDWIDVFYFARHHFTLLKKNSFATKSWLKSKQANHKKWLKQLTGLEWTFSPSNCLKFDQIWAAQFNFKTVVKLKVFGLPGIAAGWTEKNVLMSYLIRKRRHDLRAECADGWH